MGVQKNGREIFNDSDINNPDIDGGTADNTTIGGSTPAAGSFTTLKMTTGAAVGVVVSDGSGNLVADTTPTLGTPSSGTLDNCTTATATDNDADTTLSSTAYAKSQDAVLHREPDQGVALTAAAIAAIKNTHSTVFSNTTNSFLIGIDALLPTWTPAATQVLRNKWAANVGYKLECLITSGIFRVTLNATAYDSAVPGGGAASNLVAGTRHKVLAIVTVGASTTTVSFILDGVLLSTTAAQANVDVTTTQDMYTGGNASVTYAMTVFDTYDYNRALTAAEVLDLYRNGVAFADKWGSQTEMLANPNFATDTNWNKGTGWTLPADGTAVATSASDSARLDQDLGSGTFKEGKFYRISIIVSEYTSGGVKIQLHGDTLSSTLSTIGTLSLEFQCGSNPVENGYLYIHAVGTTTLKLSSASVKETGATLALLPATIRTPKWYDASSNALDASYPTTGSSLTLDYQLGTESLLSITNVSLAANADTSLYTVPTGRRLVLTKAIVIAGADAGATTALSIGADGAETDFVPAAVLSNLDAANDVVILQPAMVAALPAKNKSYAAGTAIQAQVATQSGGATNSIQLYGILY